MSCCDEGGGLPQSQQATPAAAGAAAGAATTATVTADTTRGTLAGASAADWTDPTRMSCCERDARQQRQAQELKVRNTSTGVTDLATIDNNNHNSSNDSNTVRDNHKDAARDGAASTC